MKTLYTLVACASLIACTPATATNQKVTGQSKLQSLAGQAALYTIFCGPLALMATSVGLTMLASQGCEHNPCPHPFLMSPLGKNILYTATGATAAATAACFLGSGYSQIKYQHEKAKGKKYQLLDCDIKGAILCIWGLGTLCATLPLLALCEKIAMHS